jgi:hypothetical protein
VGLGVGLDVCPHLDSNPGPSSPYRVSIPTALFRPPQFIKKIFKVIDSTPGITCRLVVTEVSKELVGCSSRVRAHTIWILKTKDASSFETSRNSLLIFNGIIFLGSGVSILL